MMNLIKLIISISFPSSICSEKLIKTISSHFLVIFHVLVSSIFLKEGISNPKTYFHFKLFFNHFTSRCSRWGSTKSNDWKIYLWSTNMKSHSHHRDVRSYVSLDLINAKFLITSLTNSSKRRRDDDFWDIISERKRIFFISDLFIYYLCNPQSLNVEFVIKSGFLGNSFVSSTFIAKKTMTTA